MAGNLITSLLSLASNLLPSITASAHAPSSSSNSKHSEKGHAVEEDLERLMRTLERIKATLYDAEEREISDRSVKLWLKELKKVAYDAEDVLSEYRYEVIRLQVEARKSSQASSSQKRKQMEYIVPIFEGMVDRLNKIRIQFDEIAKDREALQLKESDGVRRPNNKTLRPPTSHMVDEASIFGRGVEITKVINFLLSEKEKENTFSVISIVGKGGLGKTTIAQMVYKDERVTRGFDLFGWVCVSEEFDVGRLTKAIIESLTKINYGLSELSSLQEKLAETVNGKTIVLVLDDMWNENRSLWELLRVPFKEAKLVRIIVTRRNKKVADVIQTITCIWPTNLPEDLCWLLFQHYAFSGTSDTVPKNFEDMGREIMRKCGGLPLTVKSIASLLRHESHEKGWREILESDLWESNPSNDIFPALQISYAHLPSHLKPCFLFCSMYPKDYLLKNIDLILLWISQGYIESKGKRTSIEIGVEYYEELKARSFLEYEFYLDYNSECCGLHDIIHDLGKLNSENEHYSVEINQPLNTQEGIVPRETYHLYARGFMSYVDPFLQQNLKRLRTLSMDLRPCGRDSKLNEKCSRYEVICLTKLEAVRILELKAYDLAKIPDSISELKHLAYLGITSSCLKMLPLSIGLLYNLNTFLLDCPILEYLPESIGHLANLQFLYILSSKLNKLPMSLFSLGNLLRLIITSDDLEEVPLDIKNLRKLYGLIIRCNQIRALPNTIGCLASLEELAVGSHHSVNHKVNYVPDGLVNFPSIKTIRAELEVKTIDWLKDMKDFEGNLSIEGLENMSNLVDARLANLRNKCKLDTLELYWGSQSLNFPFSAKPWLLLNLNNGCEGGSVGADDACFSLLECLQPHPNLKELRLSRYFSPTLPQWMRDPFSLQLIQQITLEYCPKIQSLPFGNLHTLKNLIIGACSGIRVLQLEQLSSQLEQLQICYCSGLELITGLGHLAMLVDLKIFGCTNLISLTMDGLQLGEYTEAFVNSSYEKPHIDRQSISSLTRLEFIGCHSLCVLPDGLIPSGPCYVRVSSCGCPDVKIGHDLELIESVIFSDVFLSPIRNI